MNEANGLNATRYGIDPYLDWVHAEAVPVVNDYGVDLLQVETAEWPRFGMRGAAVHLQGRGDFCSMFVFEIPPGASSSPQRHLYEEVMYVLEGRGSTQIEFAGGIQHSFEWGPRSLFAIPLNARYRLFNASGKDCARLVSTTDLPLVMNTFHNEKFIFENDFDFSERAGKGEHFTGQGDLITVRPGNHMWETNFVPDLAKIRAQSLGRPRRRRQQYHVRAGRRHNACPHFRNARRHLQKSAPAWAQLPRDVCIGKRALAALVRRRARFPEDRLETWRGLHARRPAVSSALHHQQQPRALLGHGRRRLTLSIYARPAKGDPGCETGRKRRGLHQHKGGRGSDSVRGSGSAHPRHVARRIKETWRYAAYG